MLKVTDSAFSPLPLLQANTMASENYTDIKFEIKGRIGMIKVLELSFLYLLSFPNLLRHHSDVLSSTGPKRSTHSAATSFQKQ